MLPFREFSNAPASAPPTRDQVPDKYKWRLEDFYANLDAWQKDIERTHELSAKLLQLRTHLSESGETLLQAFTLRDALFQITRKMWVYSNLLRDQDTSLSASQALVNQAQVVAGQAGGATSFVDPEVLAIAPARLEELMKQNPGLAVWRHQLENLRRMPAHMRSPLDEGLLAISQGVSSYLDSAYTLLTNADMKLPVVQDESGKPVQLTPGIYGVLLLSHSVEVRRNAFMAMNGAFFDLRNTIGDIYAGHIEAVNASAREHKFADAIEAALFGLNIPRSVFDNLIKTVNENLKPLQRYFLLLKEALAVQELHYYDFYVPPVKDLEYKVTYEQAKEIVLAALAPLGRQYVEALRKAFDSRWIDVVETLHKRSGGYTWAAYPVHPVMLLNWQDVLDMMYTLAHEAGHLMQTYLSYGNQPFTYGDYTNFIAECPSKVNEGFLTDYLLRTVTDPSLRVYILSHAIEGIRGTLYHQTLFTEFERDAHLRAQAGEQLTGDLLSQLYIAKNKQYYEPAVTVDDLVGIGWARVPHFYNDLTVFHYAIGIAADNALRKQIISEGEPARKRYLRFLAAGSSKDSLDLFYEAGVDMTSPEPIVKTVEVLVDYINQFEEALRKLRR